MFCGQCGSSLGHGARFCSACGAPALAAQPVGYASIRRWQRPREKRVIAGVCAGLAERYRLELLWVRVAAVALAIFSSGAGVVAYIVFWIVMPEQQLALPSPYTAPSQTPPV